MHSRKLFLSVNRPERGSATRSNFARPIVGKTNGNALESGARCDSRSRAPVRGFKTRILRGNLSLALFLLPGILTTGFGQDAQSDRNAERLQQYLKQHPKADLDGDGKLTMDERRAYLRKQVPTKASQEQPRQRQRPTQADVRYGPHERNVLDVYLAKSDSPTPLVIYIHGGGFRGGDKRGVSAGLIERCHQAGISVASLNYRLTDSAPFPAQMNDCARAVQHLRANAKKWNLDQKRFGCTGGSAGAGISLWLAFRDDMADAKSDDPIARQSTRISAAAVSGAQVAYDPRWIKEHIGGRAHEHTALKALFASVDGRYDSPEADRLFKLASPIRFVTKDDPPVWLIYRDPKADLPSDAKPGQGIHHPKFGLALKEKMDPLGIECVVKHVTDFPGGRDNEWPRKIMDEEITAFFVKHLLRDGGTKRK